MRLGGAMGGLVCRTTRRRKLIRYVWGRVRLQVELFDE